MNSNLYWRPKTSHAGSLSNELKHALRNFLDTPHINETTLNESHLGLILGLKIAGVRGASELYSLIEQHEEILIQEL